MQIKDLLNQNRKRLRDFSPTPDLDAEILLSSVIKKDREFLFSYPEQKISQKKIEKFEKLIQRRGNQEPVAYLIKERIFYGRPFLVSSETLIPRPETESLIEKTLEYCHKEFYPSKDITLIDIGTGSGCILISLLKELQKSRFRNSNIKAIGTDISPEALKIAKKNGEKLVPEIKIDFLEADLLKFLQRPVPNRASCCNPPFLAESSKNSLALTDAKASRIISNIHSKNDKLHNKSTIENKPLKRYLEYLSGTQLVITANLPYLSQNIYKNCPKSVLEFEPKKALIADRAGLGFYLDLLTQIKDNDLVNLVQNLYLIFEISPEQEKIAENEFRKIFPEAQTKFSKDLAQKWRFIEIIL